MAVTCFDAVQNKCVGLPCLPCLPAKQLAGTTQHTPAVPLPTLLGGLRTSLGGGAAREAVKKVNVAEAFGAAVSSEAFGEDALPSPTSMCSTPSSLRRAVRRCEPFTDQYAENQWLSPESDNESDEVPQHVPLVMRGAPVSRGAITPHSDQCQVLSSHRSAQGFQRADIARPIAEQAWAVSQVLASRAWETSQVVGAQALLHGRDACCALAQRGSVACSAATHRAGELAVQSWPHVLEAGNAAGRTTAAVLHHTLNKIEGCLQNAGGGGGGECSDDEEEGAESAKAQQQAPIGRKFSAKPPQVPDSAGRQQRRSTPPPLLAAPGVARSAPPSPAGVPVIVRFTSTPQLVRPPTPGQLVRPPTPASPALSLITDFSGNLGVPAVGAIAAVPLLVPGTGPSGPGVTIPPLPLRKLSPSRVSVHSAS